MSILGFELSTATGSMVVLSEGRQLASRSWHEQAPARQRLFAVLPELLDEAGVALSGIDAFAVGLGPGSFSGLRIALMTARAMAMPDNRPVCGVSSAEAIAWDVTREFNGRAVVTVGDARRGKFWYAVFRPNSRFGAERSAICLVTPGDLASVIPADAVVVTPEWDRIEARIRECGAAGMTIIEENRAPTARAVAELAAARLETGAQSDPLTPIYLHPPVAAKPDHSGRASFSPLT